MVSVAAKVSLRKEMKVVLKGLTKEARWVVIDHTTRLIYKHLNRKKEIANKSVRWVVTPINTSLSFLLGTLL